MSSSPPAPTAAEIDILAVLWNAVMDETDENGERIEALKVSQVHERLAARRAQHHETQPSLTTVSSQLRALLAKQLVQTTLLRGKDALRAAHTPVRRLIRAASRGPSATPPRGLLRAATRSPLTAYLPSRSPGDVLRPTLEALASAYPASKKREALMDFAKALGLGNSTLDKLRSALDEDL